MTPDLESFLVEQGAKTHKLQGDELLHGIHKTSIEADIVNVYLHTMVRRRLNILIVLCSAILATLLLK